MSGLLERIVRRRRASASSRLGPHSLNGAPPPVHVNGSDPVAGGNGAAPVTPASPAAEPALPGPPAEAALAPREAPIPVTVEAPVTEALEDPQTEAPEDPQTDAPEAPQTEPPPPASYPISPRPGFRERGRIRRRARYLRQLREIQLRDIGGFLLELKRFNRERPDLVAAKLEGAADTDRELRALDHVLRSGHRLRELREPGVGGACAECGAIHGTGDSYCASCGQPLSASARLSAPEEGAE